MDKKTMLRVFGEAFLRSMVVLMAIAIIGFAAFFAIKVISDKSQSSGEDTQQGSTYSEKDLQQMLEQENANDTAGDTTEAASSEAATTEAQVQAVPSTDKKIVVLNSTSTAGLAGKWKDKLAANGFSSVGAGNYSAGTESQTKIYVKDETMGQDLLTYFPNASIQVGSLDSGAFSITAGNVAAEEVDIYIVIGSDSTNVQ